MQKAKTGEGYKTKKTKENTKAMGGTEQMVWLLVGAEN